MRSGIEHAMRTSHNTKHLAQPELMSELQPTDLIVALRMRLCHSQSTPNFLRNVPRIPQQHKIGLASLARTSAWTASYECGGFRHNLKCRAISEVRTRCCRSRFMKMAPSAGWNSPAGSQAHGARNRSTTRCGFPETRGSLRDHRSGSRRSK